VAEGPQESPPEPVAPDVAELLEGMSQNTMNEALFRIMPSTWVMNDARYSMPAARLNLR
jgi:hypothetical protein